MSKKEPKSRTKTVSGRFTREEFARTLLDLSVAAGEWGPIHVEPLEGTETTLQRMQERPDASVRSPRKLKRGPKSNRPRNISRADWKKRQNAERAARYRARKKQAKKGKKK